MRAAPRFYGLVLAAVMAAATTAGAIESPTSYGEVARVDTPILRVPQAETPPTIDGTMEEGEWEDASAWTCFWYDYAQADFRFLAPIQTQLQVYSTYDRENIYFAYTSPVYPENSWLKAKGRFPDVVGHPLYGILWDDHIELEVRPVADNVEGFRRGLFKWIINPTASTSDQYWSQNRGPGQTWQSRATVRCGVTGKRWVLEIAIPLENMVTGNYAGKDKQGRPIVPLPPPPETAYRVWFTRAIGGNGPFFNASDAHVWNTTKTKLVLDPAAVGFQINELGPIMEDVIDVQLTMKNHNSRSETVRIGFFVESDEGLIYSSYDAPELNDGLVELVPGEVRKVRLQQPFPGIARDGNALWVDVRSAGNPAKVLFRTRLVPFHSMEGGAVMRGEEVWSFRERRIEIIRELRPPRRDFDWWYNYNGYTFEDAEERDYLVLDPENPRISSVIDIGMYGATEEAQKAVEAKLLFMEAWGQEKTILEADQRFRGDFSIAVHKLPKLTAGKQYRISLLLFDRNKRIVGERNTEPFTYVEQEWQGNDIGLDDVVWEPFTPMEPGEKGFETLKHSFEVGESGLPAQVRIKPDPRDLPLEKRGQDAKLSDAELVALGRGPQVRSPWRLEAVVGGQRVKAEITQPAKLVRTWKSELEYASAMKVGPVDVQLRTQYDCDGAMHVRMTYSGGGQSIDALELVAPVDGQVDVVNSALYGGGMTGADIWEVSLPDAEGVVWDSATLELPELYYTRFVPWMFFGSGDRGWSWYCDSDENWMIEPEGSTMTLERDKQGKVTWRVKFVNHAVQVKGRRTIEFTVLTHPSKPKPDDYREIAWFFRGDTWARGYMIEPIILSPDELRKQWRFAAGAPKDTPDAERTTFRKDTAPWNRFGRWRNIGVTPEMNKHFEQKAVYYLARQIREGRRTGYWWDEYWPTYRSTNLATGDAHVRDAEAIGEKELPWQDGWLTGYQRNTFKRLARVWKEENVPQRNFLWANNSATLLESCAWDTQWVEECGAAHRSFEVDGVVQYPASLCTYMAHNYTGLICRISPDVIVALNGDDKRLDRQLLGRALLHDIGVGFEGPHGYFVHKEQAIRLFDGLREFGFFDDDQTEKIPFWRNDVVTVEGPEKVYCSVYRRALDGDRKGCKAMIVLMNEMDEHVDVTVRLADVKRVLGGANTLTVGAVQDDVAVPEGLGDWWKDLAGRDAARPAMMDVENGAVVDGSNAETYGPVRVRMHDFRVLYVEHEAK